MRQSTEASLGIGETRTQKEKAFRKNSKSGLRGRRGGLKVLHSRTMEQRRNPTLLWGYLGWNLQHADLPLPLWRSGLGPSCEQPLTCGSILF